MKKVNKNLINSPLKYFKSSQIFKLNWFEVIGLIDKLNIEVELKLSYLTYLKFLSILNSKEVCLNLFFYHLVCEVKQISLNSNKYNDILKDILMNKTKFEVINPIFLILIKKQNKSTKF